MKRVEAGNVRVRGVEGLAACVQEVEGLKRVAAALRDSGLVQVDEGQRMFGMHQLLQQAVGMELGWLEQCQRMRQLLHARCGQFGDESLFDAGLYGVMRDVASVAVAAAVQVNAKERETEKEAWCSGMLLRLCDIARSVYGTDDKFFNHVFGAAHGSLVGDLVEELVIREGCTSAGRCKTLQELVHDAPHVWCVVEMYPEFDLTKCLNAQWKRAARARLLAGLVRAHVREEGGAALRMQAVAAVPLMRDVAGSGEERDVEELLRDCVGLRIVEEGGCRSCRVEAEGKEGAKGREDGGAEGKRRALRAMRWMLQSFLEMKLKDESIERMIDEITGVYVAEEEGVGKWEVGVALGAAFQKAGKFYDGLKFEMSRSAYKRALDMRLPMLGEQHPETGRTLAYMGVAHRHEGVRDTAIKLHERALRIFEGILGLHPATAYVMSNMGAEYSKKGRHKEAIELCEHALRIHERTVGRMHRIAVLAMYNLIKLHRDVRDFAKAEELGQEALDIRTKTLGPDHEETTWSRSKLVSIQQEKARAKKSVRGWGR